VELIVQSISELNAAARSLLSAHPDARVFAFTGKMGAGKTTFIKAICQVLEVRDIVQSPTFSIINEYKTVEGDSIFHFDFYRIVKLEEVYDIGYEDYLYSGSFCLIEWPEMMEELLPPETVKVTITANSFCQTRKIEFQG